MGILFILGFIFGVKSVTFRLNPNIKECFAVNFVDEWEQLFVTYQATPSEVLVDSTFTYSANDSGDDRRQNAGYQKTLFAKKSNEGSFDISGSNFTKTTFPVDGDLCFRSLATYGSMMSFDLRKDDQHMPNADDTTKLTESALAIVRKLEILQGNQHHSLARQGLNKEVNERTNKSLLVWAAIEVIIITVLMAFQIYYVRSLFEVKTLV